VCGTEDITTKSTVNGTVNILRGIRRRKKWKTKLQSLKNGIIAMMCNVKRRGVKQQ
jgi:hypothetical protein